jgi:hypothetical protein
MTAGIAGETIVPLPWNDVALSGSLSVRQSRHHRREQTRPQMSFRSASAQEELLTGSLFGPNAQEVGNQLESVRFRRGGKSVNGILGAAKP